MSVLIVGLGFAIIVIVVLAIACFIMSTRINQMETELRLIYEAVAKRDQLESEDQNGRD